VSSRTSMWVGVDLRTPHCMYKHPERLCSISGLCSVHSYLLCWQLVRPELALVTPH
jgi:hypothetical protein